MDFPVEMRRIVGQEVNVNDVLSVSVSSGLPVGSILPFVGELPLNYMLITGADLSRGTYSELFDAMGITMGDGNGISTYSVPTLDVGEEIHNTPTAAIELSVTKGGSGTLVDVDSKLTSNGIDTTNVTGVIVNIDASQGSGKVYLQSEDGTLKTYIPYNYSRYGVRTNQTDVRFPFGSGKIRMYTKNTLYFEIVGYYTVPHSEYMIKYR